MTRYDDDAVITLLKHSVPQPPELPGRTDAVRRLAGRQRHLVATQTLGCVALVIGLIGGTVALAGGDRPGPGGLRQISFAAAGPGMAAQSTARLDLTIETTGESAERMRITGIVDLKGRFAKLRLEQTTHGHTDRSDLIQVGDAMYVTSDELPAGKRWLRAEPGVDGDGQRDTFGLVAKALLESVTSATAVGNEEVRGVWTTKFEIDRGKLVDALELELTGTPAGEFVWLDGDGLIRRYAVAGATGGGTASGTLELYDYGVQEQVEPPPADQVVDGNDGDIVGEVFSESESVYPLPTLVPPPPPATPS